MGIIAHFPLGVKPALPGLYLQSFRPEDPEKLLQAVSLLDAVLKRVECYRLRCNMDPEAARIAYEGIHK